MRFGLNPSTLDLGERRPLCGQTRDFFENRALQLAERVTGRSLQDAAARYLDPVRRVTLSVVPRGRTDLAAADSSPVSAA